MIRRITLLVVAVVIAVVNYLYGSVISAFLSVSIIAAIGYYLFQIEVENQINHKRDQVKNPSHEQQLRFSQVIQRYRILLPTLLLCIVYLAAMFTISRTTMPGGNQPWFLNNDYHTLAHKGLTFSRELSLIEPRNDSLGRSGTLKFIKNGNQATVVSQEFYTPVFIETHKDVFTPANNIFSETFSKKFQLKNGFNTLQVESVDAKHNWFQQLFSSHKEDLQITITSNDPKLATEENLTLPYQANITIPFKELKEGMALYNYLLDTREASYSKPDAAKVLEHLLQELGNTYVLANTQSAEPSWYIFPDQPLIENGYSFSADGKPSPAKTTNSFTLAADKFFYVGFHNKEEKAALQEVAGTSFNLPNKGSTLALLFHYPPQYLLNSPSSEQQAGDKNLRFLTTDIEDMVDDPLGEGFLFRNFNLDVKGEVQGALDYYSQAPGNPLVLGVSDIKGKRNYEIQDEAGFSLQSNVAGVSYLFQLKDFSKNGFAHNKLLVYVSILFLAILVLLIFFPGKNLSRIEPIIWVVIFTLTVLRLLLFWRLATFPPLKNISAYELEHTLRRFDFDFIISWPIPLTLVWILGFIGLLGWYRYRVSKGKTTSLLGIEKRMSNFGAKLYTAKRKLLRRAKIALPSLPNTTEIQQLRWAYATLLLSFLILFFLNKYLLHTELITRVFSILLPLLAYCYVSVRANKIYVLAGSSSSNSNAYLQAPKAFIHYLVHNPTFWMTLWTLGFFALTDRGFAVLFGLFILLKNIFLNFLKKPFESKKNKAWQMIFQPSNYWLYGVLALVVYLLVLSIKSLFYYGISYKLFFIGALIALPTLILWSLYPTKTFAKRVMATVFGIYLILMLLPVSRQAIDQQLTNAIRHVQYRASILHQPISKMLEEHPYSSFQTKKIIETAENQWFINSYLQLPHHSGSAFNLRGFSKVGVNYNTQTRDVVIARFVIGEWGAFTMYLILILCLLPLLLYLISYKITNKEHSYKLLPATYGGLIPLLIFFTICLFVWLTSTNRFVFFGQDYPFLSLTSRLSVMLPLALFGITLLQQPVVAESRKLQLQKNLLRYAFFFLLIAAFALTTVRKNEISKSQFSVVVDKTKQHINKDLEGLLTDIQDSVRNKNKRLNYAGLITLLQKDTRWKTLVEDSVNDVYTRSILQQFIQQPANGFKLNNPLFIRYEQGAYHATYNEHLYVRLPLAEGRNIWHGSITENLSVANVPQVRLNYHGESQVANLPYYRSDVLSNIQIGLLPGTWLASGEAVGLLNVSNALRRQTNLFIYKSQDKNMRQQSVSFVSNLRDNDVAFVNSGSKNFQVSFNSSGHDFAKNKWVNGTYRVVYPKNAKDIWVMHLAESLRATYSEDSLVNRNFAITLDQDLQLAAQQAIQKQYASAQQKNNRFKFTAIAADGLGNIRMMASHVTNRKQVNPNDLAAIEKLRLQNFFFSNVRNERDQWGNPNFLTLPLGPGSSIKPLVAALNASAVNAGWEQLSLEAPQQAEYQNYAGYKMIKPWKNADHYRAGPINLSTYIEASSNFYQSLMIFLGSYPHEAFTKNGRASLANILKKAAGNRNDFPLLQFAGQRYYLPNFAERKSLWPKSDFEETKQPTYFGNQQSILATAFELNGNLLTKDKDKDDRSPYSYEHVNLIDTTNYKLMLAKSGGYSIWCFPEQSSFLQSLRAYTERSQNFNLGLKTTALGGYPYQITPAKMLEMYMSLFAQNRNFSLHVATVPQQKQAWFIDSTWTAPAFKNFLAQHIFKGMHQVVYGGSGTAKRLQAFAAKHPEVFVYAKTGTINEEGGSGKDSRRLVVCLTNKDMQQAGAMDVPDFKQYGFYFSVENNQDFDWDLLLSLMEQTYNAASCRQYFNSTAL